MKELEEFEDEPPEWPFPHIPPDLYWALPAADRVALEQIIRDMLAGRNTKH